MKSRKRPVTIVTGCLGSGKTTFLSNILKETNMEGIAVIVNEFGKVGLDHHLIRKVDEQTVLLGGGCVCCSTREDLVKELKILLNMDDNRKIPKLKRIIIETTGLADPAPIIFTILSNPVLQHHFYVDSVITTVDAVNGKLHLKNQSESVKQIAVADKIIITKSDIATHKQTEELSTLIQELNPSAEIITSNTPINSNILSGSKVKDDYEFEKLAEKKGLNKLKDNNIFNKHNISDIRSISFTFDEPLDWTAFGLWLSMLLHARGEEVLRVKGLIDVGESGPVVLNGVQHIIHPPDHLNKWPGETKTSYIVFIIREIKPVEILNSLQAFQDFLGSSAQIHEINYQI